MKIAIIGSVFLSVPPEGFAFGAQEYLQYQLAKGLTKKGHDVTLFATGKPISGIKKESVFPIPVAEMKLHDTHVMNDFELINLSYSYQRANKFDIINNHLLPLGLPFAPLFSVPTVHTLHHYIYHDRGSFFLYKQ